MSSGDFRAPGHAGPGTFDIVAARSDDIEGLLDVLASVAAEGRWIATELPIDREARRGGFCALIARDDAACLIAVADGSVVGEATLKPQWPGLLVLSIAVLAPWRSCGVGRALLARCIEWARRSAAHKICLEVFAHNAAAIALYEQFGFVQEGYFRQHLRRRNGDLMDSIPMGLQLE